MIFLKSELNFLIPAKVKKMIRLGRNFDGGYIVCDKTLKKCKNLISLGVGDDTSFERDFDELKFTKKIYLYDYSVNFALFFKIIFKYIRRFLLFRCKFSAVIYSINNFVKFKNFISKKNVKVYKQKVVPKCLNSAHVSLDQIFSRINLEKDNLLKIDIEGDEYKIINQVLKFHNKIQMLIIEFHWINENKKIFEKSIKKLNKRFQIIHLHANNYKKVKKNNYFFDVVEISFINRKNYQNNNKLFRYNFPISGLDFECFEDRPKINFSFIKRT